MEHLTFYRDSRNEWRWRLTAKENGNVLADSGEGYVTFEDSLHGAKRVLGTYDTREVNDEVYMLTSEGDGIGVRTVSVEVQDHR